MHILPICFTVYKMYQSNVTPVQGTFAIVPFLSRDSVIESNTPHYNPDSQIKLFKIWKEEIMYEFESILDINNYVIYDESDTRAKTWCKEPSNEKVNNFSRKMKKLKDKMGGMIRAEQQLDNFLSEHETNSIKLAVEMVRFGSAHPCYRDYLSGSGHSTLRLSQVLGEKCNAESILALIEAGYLKATGNFASMALTSIDSKHHIEIDEPLELKKYIDFGGFDSYGGYYRLIGVNGTLRLLKTGGMNDEIFEVCNKFGDKNPKYCQISEFKHRYLGSKYLTTNPLHKGKSLKLGNIFHERDVRP